MRNVSENYNPFPTIRSADVSLDFTVISTHVKKSEMSISTDTSPIIGQISDAINDIANISYKYATLERNGWALDGTFYIIPESGAETGVWFSGVSDSDGTLASPITVSVVLPKIITSLGWTFSFDLPTHIYGITVRAVSYNNEGEIIDDYTGTVVDDTVAGNGWRLAHIVSKYKRVDFTFYDTNEPYRYLRLSEIYFGVFRTFNKSTIGNIQITQDIVLDGSALPAKKLVFEFDNSDKGFNVLNPVEVYQYWRSGQGIDAFIKIGDEYVNIGTYFVSRAEIGKNYLTAKVTAYDEVRRLGSDTVNPGSLAELTSVTLREAAEKVLEGYDDLAVNYNGLENEPVSMQISNQHERRTVLHWIAQAARATVWIDRDQTVQFWRPSVKEIHDAELTADEMYNWHGAEISENVDGIVLTVLRELTLDNETYESGKTTSGNTILYYDNPCIAAEQGNDVADWLLQIANWAKHYSVKNRCDPAVELADTLKIQDIFGNDNNAVVTGLDVTYDGTLSAITKAMGKTYD